MFNNQVFIKFTSSTYHSIIITAKLSLLVFSFRFISGNNNLVLWEVGQNRVGNSFMYFKFCFNYSYLKALMLYRFLRTAKYLCEKVKQYFLKLVASQLTFILKHFQFILNALRHLRKQYVARSRL